MPDTLNTSLAKNKQKFSPASLYKRNIINALQQCILIMYAALQHAHTLGVIQSLTHKDIINKTIEI